MTQIGTPLVVHSAKKSKRLKGTAISGDYSKRFIRKSINFAQRDFESEMQIFNNKYLFNKPDSHYKRPVLLEEAISCCRKLYENSSFLKKIGHCSKKSLIALQSFTQALLHYTDLSTFQYGMWNKEKCTFVNFDLKLLRRVTGLSKHYFSQCIKRLKKSSYMLVERAYKSIPARHIDQGSPEYNKAFKAAPAKRALSLSFFIDLGFNRERIEICQRDVTNKRVDKVREERKIVEPKVTPKKTPYDYLPNREAVNKSDVAKSHTSKLKELLKNVRFGRSVQESGP